MNIGLRYEYQTPYYERFGDLAIFDPVNARFLKLERISKTCMARPQQLCAAARPGVVDDAEDCDPHRRGRVLRSASRF